MASINMNSNTFKLVKIFSGIILFPILIVVLAILWPMPQLIPPAKYETVFIKSINIIDVTSGNLLKKANYSTSMEILTFLKLNPIVKSSRALRGLILRLFF